MAHIAITINKHFNVRLVFAQQRGIFPLKMKETTSVNFDLEFKRIRINIEYLRSYATESEQSGR